MSSPNFIFSVLVPDRKGTIHTILDTLQAHGVPHYEISQTLVHGAFTITLVVSVPEDSSVDALKESLSTSLGEAAQVSVIGYQGTPPDPGGQDRYILTAIGKSMKGSIRVLTQVIFERGGNFTDFSSRVIGEEVRLVAEVDLPGDVELGQLQSDLRHAGGDNALHVRLQHQKLFTATNEVAFRCHSNA